VEVKKSGWGKDTVNRTRKHIRQTRNKLCGKQITKEKAPRAQEKSHFLLAISQNSMKVKISDNGSIGEKHSGPRRFWCGVKGEVIN